MRPEGQRSRAAERLGLAGVVLWFGLTTAVASTLLGRHLLTLPSAGPQSTSPLFALRRDPRAHLAAHVLWSGCRCSRRIAEHLATGPRPGEYEEHVLWVRTAEQTAEQTAEPGDSLKQALQRRGFTVHDVSPSELETRYGVVGVPLLVLFTPDGRMAYSGGYTDKKQGLMAHDEELMEAVAARSAVSSLPVFGCAVGAQLSAQLNPLNLP
jgi:hypothetical protein